MTQRTIPATEGTEATRPHLLDITMFWSPRSGGVARYLRSKRDWLVAQSNWRHTIMAPGVSTAETTHVAALPLPWSGGYRFPLRRAATARAIASMRPDLIEAGDPYRCAWAALDAGQKQGVPVAAFYHSNVEALSQRWLPRATRTFVRQYLRHLYRRFDAVFAPSHWAADSLRSLGLDNVILQPHGVNCDVFHPRGHDEEWRREIGAVKSDTVLLYTGRFAPEKNLNHLTAAVDLLGPPYLLVAMGDGPCPPSEHGTRVRVLPYQSDPARLTRALASADIFVHAGDQETFGLAALEALACGTPVIARACAGLTDLIDGRAAIGVDNNDAAAFAEAIASVAPTATALRTDARRRALEFDAHRTFSQLLNRYTALCLSARRLDAESTERYAA
ncbi:MAG TPA: glycosyltransferase [Burkholderiaceae bacterium]|nr:glycosyltransferase [Burkholderiaceae bacterium]